jgi:hypothetical protein
MSTRTLLPPACLRSSNARRPYNLGHQELRSTLHPRTPVRVHDAPPHLHYEPYDAAHQKNYDADFDHRPL